MRMFNPSYIEAGNKGKAIAFTVGLAVLLACSVFVSYRSARNNAERSLFLEAKRGDLSSLAQLERRGADDYIKFLAEDKTAAPEVRLAAMKTLQKLPADSTGVIALMLWIKEPIAIREGAVDYFRTRGCNDVCVAALLVSLRSIWNGDSIHEQTIQPEVAPTEQLLKESQQRTQAMVETTTSGYLELLRHNPCLTYRVAREESALAADESFKKRLEIAVGPCGAK